MYRPIVCPGPLVEDAQPLHIRVPAAGRLRQRSDLLVDQIRAIDNRRLIEGPLTSLDDSLMARVADAVGEVLDLQG